MFDYDVEPGHWCIPIGEDNVLDCPDGNYIEYGIYREEDLSYTFQLFLNDDCIFSKGVEIPV